MKKNIHSNNILLWGFSFGLPWLLIIFPGISTFNKNLKSWIDLWNILGEIIIPCAILGVLPALLQSFILKDYKQIARTWAIVSAIAYSLALPFGLILSTFSPFVFNSNLTFDGSIIMIPPVPMAMIIGGMLVGLFQLTAISKLKLDRKMLVSKLFWLLTSMLYWGLSFWLWRILENSGISLRIVSFLSGCFIGLVMGLAFVIITRNNHNIKLNN
jgi:hypothetical protein